MEEGKWKVPGCFQNGMLGRKDSSVEEAEDTRHGHKGKTDDRVKRHRTHRTSKEIGYMVCDLAKTRAPL